MIPLHKKILEKCSFEDNALTDDYEWNAEILTARKISKKFIPIISSLLEQNERLTSALTEACNGCVDQSDAFNANAKELERLASGGGE